MCIILYILSVFKLSRRVLTLEEKYIYFKVLSSSFASTEKYIEKHIVNCYSSIFFLLFLLYVF